MSEMDSMNEEEIYNQAIKSKNENQMAKAVELFKSAAEKGDVNSMNELGEIYELGYEEVPQDINESIKYYKMSADKDDVKGITKYCSSIVNCQIQFDPSIHLQYFEKALEKCEFAVEFSFIKMYYFGNDNVKKNKVKAAELLEKAANHNINIACYLYAKMLYNGDGIQVNKRKAARYLEEMTKRKYYHKYGSVLYAIMLYKGEYINVNYKKAALLFKKAADMGNVQAMYCYGFMKGGHHDIQYDHDECTLYLQKAIDLNYDGAQNKLDRVEDEYRERMMRIYDDHYSDNDNNEPTNCIIYFMKNRNGFYHKQAEGSCKFDGTYLMPYINGSFSKNKNGSYKFDGEYLMRYNGNDFVSNKPDTYKYD